MIQEVNKGKDKKFPDMPSENEMDEFMFELGFDHNEVIEQKINVDQIDKIYF